MKVLKKYKQIIMVLLYGIFYILCFAYLEQGRGGMVYHIIHTRLDDMIPFCEFFIVPYFFWFFYVGISVFYVTCIRKEGFRKFAFRLVLVRKSARLYSSHVSRSYAVCCFISHM